MELSGSAGSPRGGSKIELLSSTWSWLLLRAAEGARKARGANRGRVAGDRGHGEHMGAWGAWGAQGANKSGFQESASDLGVKKACGK